MPKWVISGGSCYSKNRMEVSEIAVGSWMTDFAGSEKTAIAEQTIREALTVIISKKQM